MVRQVIPNRWLENNANFFSSFATIQEPTITQDEFGGLVTTWSDYGLLTAIPCSVAPASSSPQKQEARQPDITSINKTWHCTLKGHYPNQINDSQRVQIWKLNSKDEVTHLMSLNIISVEQDSHSTMTRLLCEVLSYDGN